ncbi:MAG: tetratricopeptide repeat protein, partial [Alphaproteobacteria bacterium]|nr:tetratricopeptide repeat protein [Alphaproteobacteria bacterium]
MSVETPEALRQQGLAYLRTGRAEQAAVCLGKAVQALPDDLDILEGLGRVLSDMGRSDFAEPWLMRAREGLAKRLAADAGDAAAANRLGVILQRQGAFEDAALLYRDILLRNPGHAAAALNLALCLRGMGRTGEAVDMCRYGIGLTPASSDAYASLGLLLQEAARHEEAVAAFDESLRLNPDSLYARWNKSFSLLALGRYEEGWALHEVGLGAVAMRGRKPFPEKRWQGEDISGRRLLLWAEQGLGDDMQFIRYAGMCKARGCSVLVQCPPALKNLLANCPFIDRLLDDVQADDFDIHASLMSLPYIFGTRVESIPADVPYLFVSEAARAKWAGKVAGDGFKV